MPATRFQQRVISVIGLGIAVPALVLAGLGVYLTLRISRAVEEDSVRYNTYLAEQVVEAFERELMAHLRGSIRLADNASRSGQSILEILAALEAGSQELHGAHFLPLHDPNDYSMPLVESQPPVYAP